MTNADLLYLLDEVRTRIDIPTQSCVLSHVTTTTELIERSVPVDLGFHFAPPIRAGFVSADRRQCS
jgi:ethanolamine ammonia-lyase large subunit